MSTRRELVLGVLAFLLPFSGGCGFLEFRSQPLGLRDGIVYYVDGAGGGPRSGWSQGVRQGLTAAKFSGELRFFGWQSGRGLLVDQVIATEEKRARAVRLAHELTGARAANPDLTISIIALSAGTAVTAFALEALPAGIEVDQVVFLSGSLSQDYDLAPALQHIRGKLTCFTSRADLVLGVGARAIGTADREIGGTSIGLRGVKPTQRTSPEALPLFREKVANVGWRPEFLIASDFGRHTDRVNPDFIQLFVAPALWPDVSQETRVRLRAPNLRKVAGTALRP
ncbi:MAG: hypothetical protein SF069_15130 [Phycisphaerae bacterium]|nr:hypothetical protein [Phycisphaerae bacterium]